MKTISGICTALILLAQALTAVSVAAQDRISKEIESGIAGCSEGKVRFWENRMAADRLAASSASSNIDITWYSIDIDVDFENKSIAGAAVVEGRVTGSAMSTLALDLSDSMVVSDVLLTGGPSIPFAHSGSVLRATLPAQVPVDSVVSVQVIYSGHPQESGFGTFVFGTRLGDEYAWTLSDPYGAREWWPCKDHPHDKADSVRIAVTVPDSMMVGSPGLLRSTTSSGGRTTYEWVTNYPITSYLVSFAAGVYAKFTGSYIRPPELASAYGPLTLPLEHFVYEKNTRYEPPSLPEPWAAVDTALCILEKWFGPYPFENEKYGHAQFTFGGGMEHQTLSSIGFTATSVIVHELAHQWYGDAISPKTWTHLWLSEGFATYAENIYWEERPDRYPDFVTIVRESRRRSARYAQGTLVLSDTTSVNRMFSGSNVYAKGAMLLEMLRSVIGDDAFKATLLEYISDPELRYGSATTEDFQAIAERNYGASLDTFFDQWTHGTGYPVYSMSATTTRSPAGWDVYVVLEQTQTEPASNVSVFEMPVTIAVQTTSGEERFTVVNDRRWQTFTFNLAEQADTVIFDPDGVLLRNENVLARVQSVPPVPTLDIIVPNPATSLATARFHIPEAATVSFVLYDVLGRRVVEYSQGALPAGPAEVALPTANLAGGVYFVRMETPLGTSVQKLVVVR